MRGHGASWQAARSRCLVGPGTVSLYVMVNCSHCLYVSNSIPVS